MVRCWRGKRVESRHCRRLLNNCCLRLCCRPSLTLLLPHLCALAPLLLLCCLLVLAGLPVHTQEVLPHVRLQKDRKERCRPTNRQLDQMYCGLDEKITQ